MSTRSRVSDIDPDALKVLYRLRQASHIAYLVGGSVRDLLLGRRPKDFDIGTSAHPYQVKTSLSKLLDHRPPFPARSREVRNQGHRSRDVPPAASAGDEIAAGEQIVATRDQAAPPPHPSRDPAPDVHHDNTFGTPEEDAFRRDFTINALFYDIGTFCGDRLRRAASTTCVRGVVRVDWRSRGRASRKIRSGCCGPSRWRRGSTSSIDPPILDAISAPPARDSRKLAAAAARGSTTRSCDRGYAEKTFQALARVRPARTDLRGASSRRERNVVEVSGMPRRVSQPLTEQRRRRSRTPSFWAVCWCRSA